MADTKVVPTIAEVEQKTIAIIARILQVKEVSLHDNLLNLGSDSLHASMIVAEINAMYNIKIDLQASLQCPDIESLCRLIRKSFTESELNDSIDNANSPISGNSETIPEHQATAQEARMYAIIDERNFVFHACPVFDGSQTKIMLTGQWWILGGLIMVSSFLDQDQQCGLSCNSPSYNSIQNSNKNPSEKD